MSLVQLANGTPVAQANVALVDMPAFRREIESGFQGEVRWDELSRALYSTDASVYKIKPLGVVIPKTREDIVHAVKVCHRFRCPLVMRGGGTAQGGQSIGEGLQIDISKYYNRILEINADERWVRVQPGIVLDELNAQLAHLGVRFAPDISTASRATVGGMMGNNSCGARSVIYGKTIDHVIEQVVALSDGSIAHFRDMPRSAVPTGNTIESHCYETVLRLADEHREEIDRRYPKILRRVGGYNLDEFVNPDAPVNLAKIMVGSEGTLGVVLEAKLRLVPLPKAKAVMVIGFHDLLESLSASPVILTHTPSAVEVMDRAILNHTKQNVGLERIRSAYVEGDPAATLCVEMYADHKEELPPRMKALEADLRERGLGYFYRSEFDVPSQGRIWSLREASLGLSMAMKEDAKSISFVEDTAVAPEKLSEFIGKFMTIVTSHGTTAGVYAHASVGCLHVRPVINMKTAEGIGKFESIAEKVADLVLEYGGALSGEHGDGLVRGPFMRKMFGDTLYEAFRDVKRTFDPLGILNPGKIVDTPPLTANLRYGTEYRTKGPESYFDFSDYGGFAGAVEMCSGVGACRKKLTGTMCPSYMATRDEADATRGRANVLRLAMSGQLDEAGLTSEGVYKVLDLCLECRACKAECPVNVDVARFKSEFLAHYHAEHGTSMQARALASAAALAPLGSAFAPLSNWVANSGFNKKLLGIDLRRSMPKWRRDTFEKWTKHRSAPRSAGNGVTLFNDTFTNHYDPEIGIAAVEVLERGGCRVDVVRPGCCGRPQMSKGLLKEARESVGQLVEGLFPIASRGEKILFCEPSCLSAIKEDAPSLLRGERREKAQTVANAVMLFEEYAAKLDLPLREGPKKILLHGHCHQKSMGLLQASVALLSKIPGAVVQDLDAGCCGMAGSFGYTADHYDVSTAIANRKLLPAAKAMQPGDVLVAVGTSCRHQVEDLSDAHAVHPAVLIRELMG